MVNSAKRDYYTIPEAARILSVSPSTIWRWIKSGKLRAYRVGERSIRIKHADLDDVITPLGSSREPENLFDDYDPDAVRKAIADTAGSWSDIDGDALIADIYEARKHGSRPAWRP